jgi:thiol-disulfide isomerase/thioredoxin
MLQEVGGRSSQPEVRPEVLRVGDRAPELSIEAWVKGDAVEGFKRDHVYVVEFWATWCPPCRTTIPHLTEIQERHKGRATVIGISAKDRNGETLERVRRFVGERGAEMEYTVAFDDGGKTNQAYMRAARQSGIPTAFVVDQEGRIAWIGHPMDGLDDVVDRIVSAGFDASKASRGQLLSREIQDDIREKRHEDALVKIDELVALDPVAHGQYASYKFAYLLSTKGDAAGAYAYAKGVSEGALRENGGVLGSMAWTILSERRVEHRDLDLALELATRAEALTGGKDASILDTLARAQFEKGMRERAIATQMRALEVARPRERAQFEKALATYRGQ